MTDTPEYAPPKVWVAKPALGRFANINRPTAGAQFERELPVGKHPLQLYSLGTPNGVKVTIMLEALLARSGPTPIRVFETAAILMHLAEKFGAFLPTEIAARAECLSWLFWQMGSAPYLGGGFGHFYQYAPTKIEYAIDRFAMETKRQLDVLDKRLADNEYLGGGKYTIADIAVFPWYGGLVKGWSYDAAEFLQVQDYKHVQRWADTILERPAVRRGRMVNRVRGELSSQLHERHDASDFATKTQDKLTATS